MTGKIIPRMTPQDLDEILAGYNIGKKPLAKLLGWGETAIINIKPVDGYLPDSDYVRCLERLGKDPFEYAGLLLEHKERITDIAFAKSLDAVKGYFELSDACEAAHYVWKNMPEESRSLLRLESILGWAELYSLCFFDEPIYTDVEQTGSNKSPYQRIAEKIDRYGCIRPDGLYPSDNTCEPTNEEKELLKLVASVFGWYGEKTLAALYNAEQKKYLKLAAGMDVINSWQSRDTANFEEQSSQEKDPAVGFMSKLDNEMLKKYAQRVLGRAKVTDLESFERFLHTRIITVMNNNDKKIAGALVTLDKMRRNGKRKPV